MSEIVEVSSVVGYFEGIVTLVIKDSHRLGKTVDNWTAYLVYCLSIKSRNDLVDLEVFLILIDIVYEHKYISVGEYTKSFTYKLHDFIIFLIHFLYLTVY